MQQKTLSSTRPLSNWAATYCVKQSRGHQTVGFFKTERRVSAKASSTLPFVKQRRFVLLDPFFAKVERYAQTTNLGDSAFIPGHDKGLLLTGEPGSGKTKMIDDYLKDRGYVPAHEGHEGHPRRIYYVVSPQCTMDEFESLATQAFHQGAV